MKHFVRFGMLLVLLFVVGACASAATPVPATSAPTAAPPAPTAVPASGAPTAAPATPAAIGEPETKTFAVSFPSEVGFSDIPMLAAIDTLRAQGFTIDTPFMAEDQLALEGVIKNQFQFSSSDASGVLLADQKLGPVLKVIADRNLNEWVIESKIEIKQCSDLNGKKLALHAAGSVSAAMVEVWLKQTCPEAKPVILYVQGSTTRALALMNNQFDATPLELADAAVVEARSGTKFHRLTDFMKTLPDVHTSPIFANADFIAKNPNTTRIYLKALVEEFRKVNADVEYLRTLTKKYIPGVSAEQLDLAPKAYVDLGLFPLNGGPSPESVLATIEFFTQGGIVKPGLTPDETADLSHLNAVLDILGRK